MIQKIYHFRRNHVFRPRNEIYAVMEETYKNPAAIGSFGGVDALHRAVPGKVSKKTIQKCLSGVDSYTLHKPVRRKLPANRVILDSIDQQRQIDLVDLNSLQKHNQRFHYFLSCIDILPKYAWAIQFNTKGGVEIEKAFQTIFSTRKPKSLPSDAGRAYKNKVHF